METKARTIAWLFQGCPPKEIARLKRVARIERVAAGRTVHLHGAGAVVLAGRVLSQAGGLGVEELEAGAAIGPMPDLPTVSAAGPLIALSDSELLVVEDPATTLAGRSACVDRALRALVRPNHPA